MMALANLERIHARVQLVRGKGERRRGRLCIMSFVALLAGERHTDAPTTASPFIRQFAIYLNDTMPEAERQRLKLLAPRIIGTNDGLDGDRVRLVQRIFTDEIVPRLRDDRAENWLPRWLGSDWTAYSKGAARSPQEFIFEFVNGVGRGADIHARNKIAVVAAKALVMYATSATPIAKRSWYWGKSIDLLDRLCDVGAAGSKPPVGPDRIARAEFVLGQTGPFAALTLLMSEALPMFNSG